MSRDFPVACSHGWSALRRSTGFVLIADEHLTPDLTHDADIEMIIDFIGCYIIEVVCKSLFANLELRHMITKGSERRQARRLAEKQALDAANGEKKGQ